MESKDDALRPDELLAQLGWVRALARRLVADPDVTDDVLQQVCLLALKQAPRDARSGPRLRAWLATVTRTLVWSTARADSRRVRRERTAAQPEALPSTGDIVARREALRSLMDAVTSLEEPYFSVVVEHYFDGRSVAEIAGRHGASAAAVRQQLTRARQQLRTRLHALLADERHGWLRSALPFLPGSAAVSSAPAKTLLAHFGGLLVAKSVGTGGIAKVLAVLAFLVLFLGGGWYLLREGRQGVSTAAVLDRRLAAEAGHDARDLTEPAAGAPATPLGTTAPQAERATPAHAGAVYPPGVTTFAVGGRVVDERGLPWVGAIVRAVPDAETGGVLRMETYSHLVELNELSSAVTDDEGRFALSCPWALVAELDSMRAFGLQNPPVLLIEAPGMAMHAFPLKHHDGHDREMGDLVVGMRAATITARLIDEAGAPIEGVHAGIFQGGGDEGAKGRPGFTDYNDFNMMGLARGVSDAEGQMEMRGLWPSGGAVSFRDDRHVRRKVSDVTVHPGGVTDLGDVVLQRGGEISGVVRDAEGLAIPGAEVWVWEAETAYAEGGGQPQPDDWARVDVLPAVIASLHDARVWHSDRSPVTSDAAGRFERTGLSGSVMDVFVEAEGYEPVRVPNIPMDSTKLEIVLELERTLDALVLDDVTGLPVAAASLTAFRRTEAFGHVRKPLETARRVTAGPRPGAFVVHTIGPRGTRLLASAPGYATQSLLLVEAGASGEPVSAVLRLRAASVVSGRVEDEAGAPVEGAVVSLQRDGPLEAGESHDAGGPEGALVHETRSAADGGRVHEARSAADGSFRFDSLESGHVLLAVHAPGFRDAAPATLSIDPGSLYIAPTVVLRRACGIAGTVHRADGTPAAGLWVWIPTSAGNMSTNGVRGTVAMVDHTGRFSVMGLPPGTFAVSIGERNDFTGSAYLELEVTLAESETRVLELVLPRMPTLRGWVTAAGLPVAGTRVRAIGWIEAHSFEVIQPCLADGSFVLELNREGEYRVHAEAEQGGWSPALTVQAVWGLDLSHDFELGTASIAGRVVDSGDGSAPAGMSLHLVRESEPATDWIAADASGAFHITSLHAGSYDIEARSEAYPLTAAVSNLRLDPGAQLRDVIVPVSPGAVIEGLVLDARGEPDGAWVYLIDLRDPIVAVQHYASKGVFRIQGLAAGSYRLMVADINYADELVDGASAARLAALVQDTLDLELEVGKQLTVTLRKVH